MEVGAVEEIMRNLASAREELKQRQAQYKETQRSLNEAETNGAALITAAKAKAQLMKQPWQELATKQSNLIASTERHISTLEEMLFIAMQIIQNRIERD